MNSGVDVFYWDACIFYEFIRDEPVQHLKKLAVQEFRALARRIVNQDA